MDDNQRELIELERERDSIRQKALNSSNEAAQYMVKRELNRNPPSLYNKGETVLLRIPVSKKLVKGKKNSVKSTCEGFNHEADHSMHKYFICYNDPVTLKSKKGWFKWMADCQQAFDNSELLKTRLNKEVGNAGLTYRQPPTPADGNCLFHAMNDQLIRLGRVSCSATKLRSDLVNYLRSNPSTPDGTHFSEFVSLGAWDTYLRRMTMGDWIALQGLINMLEISMAVVSSLGETGFNVICPAACENKEQATGDMALLGHEAELHYHSLEPRASQNSQLAAVQELKQKYGVGKITKEICPRCGRQFECYSHGILHSGEGGALQVYSDDSVFCNSCLLEEF
ncbi:OTU domain-containing protein [Stylophora pistillata]|uniref:OTU domain-containing protein n=1 Tax=Stylophora pistillata TaxID=50429 RepID=A0A2B4S1H4_STYPI|nr:OTU domain-containing protein [Stylophora pistillata]